MLYIDRLKLIKSMLTAKEDDDPMLSVGGYTVGGVKIGNMNYGGINLGGIPLDVGDDYEFTREEICGFIREEIKNLIKGQDMEIEEKRNNLQSAKRKKEKSELEFSETPKYRFIKRNQIKKNLKHNNIKFKRAQLLVDMKSIDSKHIELLKQISKLLTEQQHGKNKYKRKDIKKYINYAIYRIEQQEKPNINENELEQHSFFDKIRVTGCKINEGHYGENAKRVIEDFSLDDIQ